MLITVLITCYILFRIPDKFIPCLTASYLFNISTAVSPITLIFSSLCSNYIAGILHIYPLK